MRLKKFLKITSTIALAVACSQSFAYMIYNDTDNSIEVVDSGHLFGGIKMAIPPHGATGCNSFKWGCNGHMYFHVKTTNVADIKRPDLCFWQGHIPKANGNYFVISKTGTAFPQSGSCKMEYFIG